MANTPYEDWAAYINTTLQKHLAAAHAPIVLDLACGTGSITTRLAKMGYDMIGVDASVDMLAEAQQKAYEAKLSILFLAQDMQELDLYGTVDAAVCVCDGLNYLLTEEELLETFRRVKLFLNPGGVFIFDMNTEYKFKYLSSSGGFDGEAETGEAYSCDNTYDPATQINQYSVTFYSNDSEPFTEVHHQRAYPVWVVKRLLAEAGFGAAAVFSGYTGEPYMEDELRAVFVVG